MSKLSLENKILSKSKANKKIDAIIEQFKFSKAALIPILQRVQEEYRYLPREILIYIAEKLEISPAHIYGVATFYSQFSLNPKGKYEIKICDGTACHVRKSIPILKAIQEKLNLTDNKTTTDDLVFSVETVNCLGACGLAPVVVINDKIYPQMTPESIKQVIEDIQKCES
jgi:NADH-quinone oxidoreductase subunit E